jgi:hypothetical protein
MPSPGPQSTGAEYQDTHIQSRTARGDAGEMDRQSSLCAEDRTKPYEPTTDNSTPPPRDHSVTRHLLHLSPNDNQNDELNTRRRSSSRMRHTGTVGENFSTSHMHNGPESRKCDRDSSAPKRGLGPRPIGGAGKLGMFSGVYVPTCLNVLSILMFLRFGFILGPSSYRHRALNYPF